MNSATLYRTQTIKPLSEFVVALADAGQKRGFIIHNETTMEMAHTFGKHDVEVGEEFDLHMIQICKPEKAAFSLQKNPERAAWMPKFITLFTAEGQTQVRFLRYSSEMLEALVHDADFAASVSSTYDEIEQAIKDSL